MQLGAHVSIVGGITASFKKAQALKCSSFQIFTSSPRSWAVSKSPDSEFIGFKKLMNKSNISSVFGHTIYLINLASSNPLIYTNSINSIISSINFAKRANFTGIVTHIGSQTDGEYKLSIKRVLDALEVILKNTGESVPILLETDAGSGNRIGCNFSELGNVIKNLKSKMIKVCFDTCHVFASGYELRNIEGLNSTLMDFDESIGIDRLALLHLNDSKGGLGSNIDRHEVIGRGLLGTNTFKNIICHPSFKNLPGIIETPDLKNITHESRSLEILRSLENKSQDV